MSSIFLVEKKDLSKEASHHSEKLEPAYPLRTFQNGGIISFSMQGRPGRCILRYSIAGRITEIYMLQVERQTLSICLPLFWLNFGPSSLYKVDENSNSCHKEVEWKDYNLSRQHLDNSRVRGRVILKSRVIRNTAFSKKIKMFLQIFAMKFYINSHSLKSKEHHKIQLKKYETVSKFCFYIKRI